MRHRKHAIVHNFYCMNGTWHYLRVLISGSVDRWFLFWGGLVAHYFYLIGRMSFCCIVSVIIGNQLT